MARRILVSARAGALYSRSPTIGTNKRYAHHYDRIAILRDYARAMAEGKPTSLTKWETDLEHEPVTIPPAGRPVHAWVRYGNLPVRVNGHAVKWTEHAIGVVWKTPGGEEHRAWVWAGAVRPGHLRDLEPREV